MRASNAQHVLEKLIIGDCDARRMLEFEGTIRLVGHP
jgi:hypothetical protein